MDKNKHSEKGVVSPSKSQKGKHKGETSDSKSGRRNPSSKVETKGVVIKSDSSGSTDEDWVEFLRTYDPLEERKSLRSPWKLKRNHGRNYVRFRVQVVE
jgi:hypothetical protein